MRPAMLFAVLCTLTGCGLPKLPTGPSEVATGVVLYEHANFTGRSAHVTGSIADLKDFDGPCEHDHTDLPKEYDWNDCVSSLRVAPGWRATVYEGFDYTGRSYTTTEDTGNLQLVPGYSDGLNDRVSSVRVVRLQ